MWRPPSTECPLIAAHRLDDVYLGAPVGLFAASALTCGHVSSGGKRCIKTIRDFGSPSAFNRHVAGHGRAHRCRVCGRRFTQKTHRDRHQLKHR